MYCQGARYDNYTILQMAGRSQRALQRATCALYWVSPFGDSATLMTQLRAKVHDPFKAGPRVLKEMMKMATPKVNKDNDASVGEVKFTDDEWQLTWDAFCTKYDK